MTGQTHNEETSQRRATRAVGILSIVVIAALYVLRVMGVVDLEPHEELPGDWIVVRFTVPTLQEAAWRDGLDRILAADIEAARTSVDVAAYDFDLETVAQALVAAHRQGVRVRLVTDTDSVAERGVRQLARAGIPVVDDGRGSIMHNKFVVIDEEIVWTGSWNLTENGTYRNDNNAVRIHSPALAQNYTSEFEEMFVDRAFGPGSPSDTPYPHLTVRPQGAREAIHLDNYFAPEDAVADELLTLVRGAQDSIRFLAFSFTDDRLGEAIQAKARAGLVVQGVFETRGSETDYSEYGRLAGASPPLDVRLDGNPYLMHHKVMILDDEIVVLGSFNFTESANTANDENLLVIHAASVAAVYRAEFERVYGQAGLAR